MISSIARFASVAALLVAVLASTANSQNISGYTTPSEALAAAGSNLRQLKDHLNLVTDHHVRAKALYEAGQTTSADVTAAAAEMLLYTDKLVEAERNYAAVQRTARLAQPVNVDLKASSLTQAVQAISQVSSLPIRIDKDVTPDKRLTASAHGVPTATVLESIARQMNLQIAPDAEWGVVFQNWPQLKVNGQANSFYNKNSPWADSWVVKGQVVQDDAIWRKVLTDSAWTYKKSTIPAPKYNQSVWNTQSKAAWTESVRPGLTMTSVGNQVVIAEPGRGPNGEAGMWLTVYNLKGGELTRQSSLFHKAHGK